MHWNDTPPVKGGGLRRQGVECRVVVLVGRVVFEEGCCADFLQFGGEVGLVAPGCGGEAEIVNGVDVLHFRSRGVNIEQRTSSIEL
jgi:hypothetical protein